MAEPSKDPIVDLNTTLSSATITDTSLPEPDIYSGINPNDADAPVTHTLGDIYKGKCSFKDMGLPQNLLDNVIRLGWVTPSRIQSFAIPLIIKNNDDNTKVNIVGQAHAGSGKTACFALGMLARVNVSLNAVQGMCIVPTRELAVQHTAVINSLAVGTGIRTFTAVPDSERITITDHLVVGTPGSILGKLKAQEISVKNIIMFALDEADQLVGAGAMVKGPSGQNQGDMASQVMMIKRQLDKNVQVMLFSATFAPQVQKYCEIMAPKAERIKVERELLIQDKVKQYYMRLNNPDEKYSALNMLFGILKFGQTIIFCNSKKTSEDTTMRLRADGHAVALLMSNMQNVERDRVMTDFRNGVVTLLVSTNLIAYGIDVPAVSTVVNYDVPMKKSGLNWECDPETYVHRINRCGRWEHKGCAITLLDGANNFSKLMEIKDVYHTILTELPPDDIELIEKIVKESVDSK